MSYKGILSSLRNQLKPRKRNIEYLDWRAMKRSKSLEGHHILKSVKGMKKLNDMLIADISSGFHTEITYKRAATELEQTEMLVSALEDLFDYVEFLQDQFSSTSN